MSDSEPELGLGIVLRVEARRVEIVFPAAREQRLYSLASSGLRRVIFKENDRIRLHDGTEHLVAGVRLEGGLCTYLTEGKEVPETELSDTISFSSPMERLLAGQVGNFRSYALRTEALDRWSSMLGSSVRGYVGGRIDLIPHQLSIAVEVCSRIVPRVLLADEVGLGKTIEAGLILHRLHLTGRANRILLIVPEPLVHQWFVEMLRRFNLTFSIVDEALCRSIERLEPDANPFLENQLALCSIDLLTGNRRRAAQVLEAGWDMMVVDEAHHLRWTHEGSGPGYMLVEALARTVPVALLLTATPQQLGPEGHFARLRLLDPERYSDLDTFLEESAGYERVTETVNRILNGEAPTEEDRAFFEGESERVARRFRELVAGEPGADKRLIDDLLDSFGTGRVMFRNTRQALSGFPERRPHLERLDRANDSDPLTTLLAWLVNLLKELGDRKVLLICRTPATAEVIHERLQVETRVKSALFHEDLTLIQRDRNAAWFAEEEGVQILVCSEIGSEGRNFQFAHHLVLFDLPSDPELLEQRIGRLDRIGQREAIEIHVPWLPGTESEVLARWYHEGLNAFAENLHGASEIAETLRDDLERLIADFDRPGLEKLIERSVEEGKGVADRLAHGYDRLLELNSNKPERAEETRRHILAADADRTFEQFFLRLLDFFGVVVEKLTDRTYLFRPDYLLTDEFPTLPKSGQVVTFDRTRALGREDVLFMTQDHPFVLSVMELFLGGEHGNASFAVWETSGTGAVLLEVYAVLESVAPPALHVARFLPPRPVRVVVDHRLQDLTDDPEFAEAELARGEIDDLLEREGVKLDLIPSMFDAAIDLAELQMKGIVGRAVDSMTRKLHQEIERLEDLRRINDHVKPEEIEGLRARESELREAIEGARLRVSALRLILKRPAG